MLASSESVVASSRSQRSIPASQQHRHGRAVADDGLHVESVVELARQALGSARPGPHRGRHRPASRQATSPPAPRLQRSLPRTVAHPVPVSLTSLPARARLPDHVFAQVSRGDHRFARSTGPVVIQPRMKASSSSGRRLAPRRSAASPALTAARVIQLEPEVGILGVPRRHELQSGHLDRGPPHQLGGTRRPLPAPARPSAPRRCDIPDSA